MHRKTVRLGLIAVLGVINLGLTTVAGRAQDEPAEEEIPCYPEPAQRGFVGIGWWSWNLGDITDLLAEAGYDRLDSERPNVFFSGYENRHRRWVLGGSLAASVQTGDGYGTLRASHTGFVLSGEVGYLLDRHPLFNVFPLVGLSFGYQRLGVYSDTDASLPDQLLSPNGQASFWTATRAVNLGVHADYMFPLSAERGLTSGLTVGLRAQYLVAWSDASWAIPGRPTYGTTETDHGGYMIHLLIGFGTQPQIATNK